MVILVAGAISGLAATAIVLVQMEVGIMPLALTGAREFAMVTAVFWGQVVIGLLAGLLGAGYRCDGNFAAGTFWANVIRLGEFLVTVACLLAGGGFVAVALSVLYAIPGLWRPRCRSAVAKSMAIDRHPKSLATRDQTPDSTCPGIHGISSRQCPEHPEFVLVCRVDRGWFGRRSLLYLQDDVSIPVSDDGDGQCVRVAGIESFVWRRRCQAGAHSSPNSGKQFRVAGAGLGDRSAGAA